MTDPTASLFSSFSSDLADIVAKTKPAVVSVHSHRSRASGFVWKPGLDRDGRRGVGRRRRGLGQARRRNDAARQHRGTRSHDRYRAAAVRRQGDRAGHAFRRRAGSRLAVGRGRRRARHPHRSARRGVARRRPLAQPARRRDRRADRARRAAALTATRAVSLSMPPAKPLAWRYRGCDVFLSFRAATIDRVAGRLETHGRIARGYLGVGLQPVKLDDGVGAMVMSVDKIGPLGRRRHPARRRYRRLERRKTLRCAFAVADHSGPTASARSLTSRSGAAANRCGSS